MLEDFGADVTELTRTSEQVKAERNTIPFKNTYENSPQKWDTSLQVCHIEVQHSP